MRIAANRAAWLRRMALLVALAACAGSAHAAADLLLEEPFGHFGAFTQTGHAAVYLTRICASSPTVLRRCEPGENGVVISRYDKVGGYDWLAVPLIPYLYAVESPDEIPLFADAGIVSFLRDQYRHKYLADIIPDSLNGEPPPGNWVQLVGSAYDRTIYGFEIETTAEQDEAFIRAYNSGANQSHFNLLAHNCADFAREVINFYYPKTAHRNVLADAGITTPKQIAKLLIKFSAHHPELESGSYVIPQVPGGIPRSTPVHGVIESVLKSKKYLLPLALLHPIVTACAAAGYMGVDRFDPSRHALILDAKHRLAAPLAPEDREAYRNRLDDLLASNHFPPSGLKGEKAWKHLKNDAVPAFDRNGRPMVHLRWGEDWTTLGITRANILTTQAPASLTGELLAARLQEELKRGNPPRVSESEAASDWHLLQQVFPLANLELSGAAQPEPLSTH